MMAVSLLVGVLDVVDGRLELCCAGHEDPLVIDATGAVRDLRLDGGPALCVVEGYAYPVEAHRLEAGETLIALTDGVTEAQGPTGRLFGRRATMDAVGGPPRDLSDVVDTLVAGVRAFEGGAESSDDLTVLALRRRT
jgi:serine phosphatase RsbU (regulator of sigma subunit)